MIREHLARRGKEIVTPTTSLVRYWFPILNREVFGSILPMPDVILCYPMRGYYAWCGYNGKDPYYFIHFNSAKVTRRQFLMILLHEMVHAWQIQQGMPLDHGRKFMSWADKARKVGLRLAHTDI